jgi:hypothetical protein
MPSRIWRAALGAELAQLAAPLGYDVHRHQLEYFNSIEGVSAVTCSPLAISMRINLATERSNPDQPPGNWRWSRRRWETFQGVCSRLPLAGSYCWPPSGRPLPLRCSRALR